jgi:hypothetical protein
MGKFAEIAIVDHRLSFTDQGNKLRFSVSVCSKQTEIAVSVFCLQHTKGIRRFSVCIVQQKWLLNEIVS